MESIEIAIALGCEIVTFLIAIHKFSSVAVTVYVPVVRFIAGLLVCPLLHK